MPNPAPLPDRRSGITLIELSIVLVIIGLIVGVIFVGQDLIASAKLRAGVSQLTQYSAALRTFRSKYNELAGDIAAQRAYSLGVATTNSFSGGLNNGNGVNLTEDGRLEDYNGIAFSLNSGWAGATYGNWESGTVFWELANAGLISGQYALSGGTPDAYLSTTPLGPGFALPQFAVGNSYVDPLTWNIDGDVWWFIGINIVGSGVNYLFSREGGGVLTPAQAYYIDQKMDDGNPLSGSVRAVSKHVVPNFQMDTSVGLCITDATTQTYNVTNNTLQCLLMIKAS